MMSMMPTGMTIAGEVLYNGIQLPEEWPPRNLERLAADPLPVPWLEQRPAVIPIDVGRQLFVDDFLIEETTLQRTAHAAELHPDHPILKPETPLELEGGMACTFDDAVLYDPQDQLFKMYYIIGYNSAGEHHTALATSRDGVHWERPDFGIVPGTNIVMPAEADWARDNFTPWIDFNASDPQERYKGYLYLWAREGERWGHTLRKPSPEWLLTSPDGIHWTRRKEFRADNGDCTSLFYNPFREKWVLNIRSYDKRGRDRSYFERDNFLELAETSPEAMSFWLRADALDLPDPDVVAMRGQLKPAERERLLKVAREEQFDTWFGEPTQLYTIAPTPYESLMLGVFTIHYGPENIIMENLDETGPKLTQVKLGYSRDGFHFARPDREPFIAASKRKGTWDRGYVRAAGGGCVINGDKLFFYYSAASGQAPEGRRDLYAGGSMHLATLRRDGFVSLDAGAEAGSVRTPAVRFSKPRLFANVHAPQGRLRAAVLDENNVAIEPFTLENCRAVTGDSTRAEIRWEGAEDLSALLGRPVKLQFELQQGSLYAFWLAEDARGASDGYAAAGGRGFDGPTDRLGSESDRAALPGD